MAITGFDRIGGFVVGNEANYDTSTFGKSIFFAPNTKQILVDGVGYIPKTLSELVNDADFLTSSALNTWKGSNGITTLGTITSGVWHGSAIENEYLANSSISIAGEKVELGGRINSDTLKTKLGLGSNAFTSTPYLPLTGGSITGHVDFGSTAFFNQDVQVDGQLNCTSNVNVDGTTTVGELVIGSPHLGKAVKLYYDTTNDCLRVDKGIAGDSFVSAGGTDDASTIAELQQRITQLEAQLISLTNK